MKAFRLNHVLNATQRIIVKPKNSSIRKQILVEKGVTYALGDYDEEKLLDRFTEVKYTKESEQFLIDEGVEYEVKVCRQCGGKKKRIKVRTIEIIDVDPEEWEEVK